MLYTPYLACTNGTNMERLLEFGPVRDIANVGAWEAFYVQRDSVHVGGASVWYIGHVGARKEFQSVTVPGTLTMLAHEKTSKA